MTAEFKELNEIDNVDKPLYIFDEDVELEEDDICLGLFPSNVFYKKLGADWIMEKNHLTDPHFEAICEHLAEYMSDPITDWEKQKDLTIGEPIVIKHKFEVIDEEIDEDLNTSINLLSSSYNNIDKLYTE